MALNKIDKKMIDDSFVQDVENVKVKTQQTIEALAEKVGSGKKAEMEDLGDTVISAITGGATVNVLSIPQDKSVSPDKTTFLKDSNLFDKIKVAEGFSINATTGQPVAFVGNNVTDYFIKVKSGTKYIFSHSGRYALYDANFNFLKSEVIPSAELPKVNTTTATSAWMKVAVTGDYSNALVLEGDSLNVNPLKIEKPIQIASVTAEIKKVEEKVASATILKNQLLAGNYFQDTIISGVSTDSSAWRNVAASASVAGGVVALKATANKGRIASPNVNLKPNHKYYLFAKVKATSNLVGLFYREGEVNKTNIYDTHSGNGDFEYLSSVIDITINNQLNGVTVGIVDDRTSGWNTVNLDYIGLINLTEVYGVGFEPTLESLDALIKPSVDEANDNLSFKNEIKAFKDNAGSLTNSVYFIPPVQEAVDGTQKINANTITAQGIYDLYDALMAQFPNYITKTSLGMDSSGALPIYQYTFSVQKPETKLVFSSNLHGPGEGGDPRHVAISIYNLMREVTLNPDYHEKLSYLRNKTRIAVVPVVNPWGFNNNSRRNSNNVDINRNFGHNWSLFTGDFKGASAFSEVETQYVRDLLIREKPLAYLDFHAWMNNPADVRFTAVKFTDDIFNSVLLNLGDYMEKKYNEPQKIEDYTFWYYENAPMATAYAKYVLGCYACTPEFGVYHTPASADSSTNMTKMLEWYSNIVFSMLDSLSVKPSQQIASMKVLTQAQYDSLNTSVKNADNILYFIL